MKFRLKALLGAVLCVAFCCMLFVGCSDKNDEDANVEKKPAQTVEVSNAAELAAAAQYVGKEYSDYTIKLTADIDLSGVEWKPIGLTFGKAFCGTFDGNGKTISGLKITGWESDGTPKYIAKQIIGWLADGTPLYKSSEILSINKGAEVADGKYEVKGYVKEGDDEDPNFVAIDDGNGTFETETSFGSVGLFGYTFGATIKNLTVENADLSFYASGEYAYAGIISGCDVASEFTDVTINGGKIAVSTIYDSAVSYYDNYGTPAQFKHTNNNNQYVGGIVGYAKGNAAQSDSGKGTVLKRVSVNDFVFDNTEYCAYFDGGMEILGDKENAKLVVGDERGSYSVSRVNLDSNVAKEFYPKQAYIGGIAGYVGGAKFETVAVNGFNRTIRVASTNKLSSPTHIITRSLYAGGITGGLYASKSTGATVQDVFFNGIYWRDWDLERAVGLVSDKATIGGAFGIVENSSVTTGSVNGFYAEAGGTELENVCFGGFAGYVNGDSVVNDVTVNSGYMYSTFAGSSELGSIMGGAVGVLRDSSLKAATAKGVDYDIQGGNESSYIFVRGIAAQIYGNSAFSLSQAEDMRIHKNRTEFHGADYDKVDPVQTKNNYVNENGYTSVRLYYSPNGKIGGVYVTVYGELIPLDSARNLLIEEEVYSKVTLEYAQGAEIALGRYYVYDATRATFIFIGPDTADKYKKFDKNAIYAEKKTVYRVEFAANNASLASGKYYEYSASSARLTQTADTTANAAKTYYLDPADADYVASYYLDVTVYSESGNVIVTDEKDKNNDDDDILAKARYALSKEEVNGAAKTVVCGSTTYVLADAERFLNKYFASGTGFLADVNRFTIKYFDNGVTNRNFASYKLVSGRPDVDSATITYIM